MPAYLTEKGGSCEFTGKKQLYQRMEDKVVPPSESETARREKIETQLLSDKVQSNQECTDSHHCGYLEPKPGSPQEFCDCDSCMLKEQFATKKYKPVALKVKPVMGTLP